MIRYEDDCCMCATAGYPCTGAHKRVPHLYCDRCGEEVEEAYDVDGEAICEGCISEVFPIKGVEEFEER
jgi:hypothetical protein